MNIFVANLPKKFRSKDLYSIFSEYGAIEDAYIIYDKVTHNSKGYGFVIMEDEAAKKAIAELNEREFDSHIIFVAPAKGSAQQTETVENSNPSANSDAIPEVSESPLSENPLD